MKQLDLITQKICPKYPRPAKFSDPGGDFSDEELKELIRKRDNELTETDLMCIFQGALPAGEYHEVMYFLPIALQHIAENQENDTLDNLLRWISYNQEELQSDGYYDDLLKFFETLLAELTFQCVLSENYVKNSNLCETLVESLNKNHNGMGDVLIKNILAKSKILYKQDGCFIFWNIITSEFSKIRSICHRLPKIKICGKRYMTSLLLKH